MNKSPLSITTTLPYINSEPHIGFALELVQADVCARYYRSKGYDVVLSYGTDEHGQKIYERAVAEGISPQDFADGMAEKFRDLRGLLNVSSDLFVRTTDTYHTKAAQDFWQRCFDNGDIYKDRYQVKYCVGCELEKQDSELVDGRCAIHPNLEITYIDEENYFFRFSRYQEKLLELYDSDPTFVVPKHRLKEIRNFVADGLNDFSISRKREKMPWGVPVPGDDEQVMYVWFDALVNYVSVLGWPHDMKRFERYWPVIQFAGKDNLRQQTAIWQAMLMSAGLIPSKQIIIHGFINAAGGHKMSKSLGNVVTPQELVDQYGVDAVRYYLLREIPPFEDGEYSPERFLARYDSDLANTLGNLVSRTTMLAEKYNVSYDPKATVNTVPPLIPELKHFDTLIHAYHYSSALDYVWMHLRNCNEYIDQHKPWEKEAGNREEVIQTLLLAIFDIARALEIFLPETSKKIQDAINVPGITKIEPLFPKIA